MNIKDAILKMPLRADKWEDDLLVKTFVQIGPLIPILHSVNNLVLYGRRGTGKTHVLKYLKSIIERNDNDCCIFIDIRQVGSTGSIYSDREIPIEQRAIRLFTDILQDIRNQIIEYITKDDKNKEQYLSTVTPFLDGLLDLLDLKKISGNIKVEHQSQNKTEKEGNLVFSIAEKPSFSHSSSSGNSSMVYEEVVRDGHSIDYLDFTSVYQTIDRILQELAPHKLWILIDEFAELNPELQIALADMFRRVFCPLKNCVFKIATIEHRSVFKKQIDTNNYIGLELGADVNSCNLDDFMVFSNNHALALAFFRELISQHISFMLESENGYADSDSLIKDIFKTEGAFEELVQAAEGVPRDAFNILAKAVIENYHDKLSVDNIRKAAKNWYNEDKQNPIMSHHNAMPLLTWIVENVINKRHARAFLLRNDRNYDLINFLYDARILHIIKQNISSRDNPGMKFNAYSIDYGCYVDLINTKNRPQGLFEEELDSGEFIFCHVPKEDYRSIRRAILDMDEFNKRYNPGML